MFDNDAGFQGFNLYVYCGNNPINRIDISGADSEKLEDLDLDDDEIQERGGGGSTGYGRYGGGHCNDSSAGGAQGHKNATTKWDIHHNSHGTAKTSFNGSNMTAQQDSSGYYWLPDKSGHGGSAYKVFEKSGNYLYWRYDADMYGNFIYGKHKSDTGLKLPLR